MTKVHGKRYAYKFDFHALMQACQTQGHEAATGGYKGYPCSEFTGLFSSPASAYQCPKLNGLFSQSAAGHHMSLHQQSALFAPPPAAYWNHNMNMNSMMAASAGMNNLSNLYSSVATSATSSLPPPPPPISSAQTQSPHTSQLENLTSSLGSHLAGAGDQDPLSTHKASPPTTTTYHQSSSTPTSGGLGQGHDGTSPPAQSPSSLVTSSHFPSGLSPGKFSDFSTGISRDFHGSLGRDFSSALRHHHHHHPPTLERYPYLSQVNQT